MERVQFQQEQMLAELKDLVQKGLFTQNEIRQIMKKRTAFETALVRRIPKKSDFLRYAAYEMSLEALRRKRVERLNTPKGPPTVSDYALIRRQFQIFERALKKFKDDLGLWIQYIQAAQRARARALVSRICGRALQLHPNSPQLYILAASHELKHLSHAAARVLLQRGIRMNSENVELWREYVKMELGFVEALRRRWNVLGLKVAEETSEKVSSGDTKMRDPEEVEGTSGSDEALIEADNNDEQARKEILNGALVKTVISSAVKAIPTPELFTSIHNVLSTYPCPPYLRRSLLDHLHSLLHLSLLSPPQHNPSSSKSQKFDLKARSQAAKLYATRHLTADLEGEALVDALRKSNEDLMELIRTRKDDYEMASAYAQFVREWFEKSIDEHLNLYLLASLQSLCSSRLPYLCAAHLRILRSPHNPKPLSSTKFLKLARKYTSRCPTDVDLWIQRFEIEFVLENDAEAEGADWRKAWEEARRKMISASTGVGDVSRESNRDEIWLWGLERQEYRSLNEQLSEVESLLREAQNDPSSSLSEKLLIRYIHLLQRRARAALRTGEPSVYKPGSQAKEIAHLASHYLPNERTWEAAFDIYTNEDEDSATQPTSHDLIPAMDEQGEKERILRTIYDSWSLISPEARSSAALKWAEWLIRHGRGNVAARVIADARTVLASDETAANRFDQRWRDIVNRSERRDTHVKYRSDDEGNESNEGEE